MWLANPVAAQPLSLKWYPSNKLSFNMATTRQQDKLIIVVDDDEDLAFLLAAQLQQNGYKVQQCIGGINLIEELLHYQPALLLLDIAMQLVDGSELCREIKNDSRLKDIKIIMMSGNHNVADHATSCGADDFIAKPLSLSSVTQAVAKYIPVS